MSCFGIERKCAAREFANADLFGLTASGLLKGFEFGPRTSGLLNDFGLAASNFGGFGGPDFDVFKSLFGALAAGGGDLTAIGFAVGCIKMAATLPFGFGGFGFGKSFFPLASKASTAS